MINIQTNSELPGFDLPDTFADSKDNYESKDKSKAAKAKGGFQAMGLSYPVFKGITKRGYKIPTPVQRKTIPLILEGRDVVAMAKTGKIIHAFLYKNHWFRLIKIVFFFQVLVKRLVF